MILVHSKIVISMANEIHELKSYGDDYHIVLSAIIVRLPIAYSKWSIINDTDAADYTLILESVLRGVEKHVTDESDNIFEKTKSKINDYLNTFEVAPNNSIDEFKLVFFTGMTLAESLKIKGLFRESKIVLTSMVWILDYRLATVNAMREKLTCEIVKMIERERLVSETGEVGLYLIYKCLYNQAVER